MWAFGILLHEVFSNCRKQPYDKIRNAVSCSLCLAPHMMLQSVHLQEVREEVCKVDGYRMEAPPSMPTSIAVIMVRSVVPLVAHVVD